MTKKRDSRLSIKESLINLIRAIVSKLGLVTISEERYTVLTEHLPGMIYTGNEQWGAESVTGCESLSGYTTEEINSKERKWLSVIHPDDMKSVHEDSLSLNKDSLYLLQTYRIVTKYGKTRWVEDRKRFKFTDGRFEKVDGIVFDVTDRIKAELQLTKANEHQRRVSKVEAVGNFASGIAHDFNNALTPIIANCELMLYEIDRGSKYFEECKRRIRSILGAAETASLLVHRLQSFNRKDGGIENLQPIKIDSCLSETFKFLRSIVPTTIEISTYVENGLRTIFASDITIRQILMNLCKNSSQAISKCNKGRISISVRNEDIKVERYGMEKGEYIKLEVEDDGKGMTPEIMERCLDPYFSTKPEGEGTGIGLSVVNNIVRGYGGLVRIYSNVGKGTKVVIYIPAIQVEKEKVVECQIEEETVFGNGEKILIVDDEQYVIEATVGVLRSLNYDITHFISSPLALKEIKDNPNKYDLLITDLTMPGMTGVNLILEARKIVPDLRAILCSGLGSNGVYLTDRLKGAVEAYLTKPITRSQYSNVLGNIFKKGK